MFNYKMTIQYDGTNYAGWQIQQNAVSVQEIISKSIKQIIQEEVNLIGSGRTDAGVHALGQVANFISNNELDLFKFKYSLNSVLPNDISISVIESVDINFHSRFDAKKRAYIYLITTQKSPFYNRYAYHLNTDFEISKMNELASVFIGKKDFTSFSKNNPDAENKICEVFEAHWRKQKNLLIFYIEANRFLYGMVRASVGSILKAYNLEDGIKHLEEIFNYKNRNEAADAVTAKGLFLYKVKY